MSNKPAPASAGLEGWALVEFKGRRQRWCHATRAVVCGLPMIRCVTPRAGRPDKIEYFDFSSLYRITFHGESAVRAELAEIHAGRARPAAEQQSKATGDMT